MFCRKLWIISHVRSSVSVLLLWVVFERKLIIFFTSACVCLQPDESSTSAVIDLTCESDDDESQVSCARVH